MLATFLTIGPSEVHALAARQAVSLFEQSQIHPYKPLYLMAVSHGYLNKRDSTGSLLLGCYISPDSSDNCLPTLYGCVSSEGHNIVIPVKSVLEGPSNQERLCRHKLFEDAPRNTAREAAQPSST